MRYFVVISAVVALAAVGLGFFWLRDSTPTPPYVLSDGSVLTFKGASFGTNHMPPLASSYLRYVPRIVSRWLPQASPTASFKTESRSIVLWFSRVGASAGMRNYECTLVHEDGFESQFGSGQFYARYSPTNSVEGVSAPYAQRERVLHVRVYEQKSWDDFTLLGDFAIRNPHASNAPRRDTTPLPQTARDGDLEVTLASLLCGGQRGWDKTNFASAQTVARFEISDQGRPSTNWTVQRMEASDSTGNRLASQSWGGKTDGAYERFECKPSLWPSESYKLRFEFSRKTDALFESNELWIIRGVTVPTNGGFHLVNAITNLQGFKVRFHGLATANASAPWETMSSPPSLGFSLAPEPKGFRFSLVQVTDDRGRRVRDLGSGYSSTNWGFSLQLSNDVKTVDVTVALHRSCYVEFLAQPARAESATMK